MIKTGHAGEVYTDTAVRHVLMRQGVIGIKVQIMLPQDLTGVQGPKIPLDDVVTILEPKEELSPEALLAAQAQAAAAYAPQPPAMDVGVPPPMDPAAAAGF